MAAARRVRWAPHGGMRGRGREGERGERERLSQKLGVLRYGRTAGAPSEGRGTLRGHGVPVRRTSLWTSRYLAVYSNMCLGFQCNYRQRCCSASLAAALPRVWDWEYKLNGSFPPGGKCEGRSVGTPSWDCLKDQDWDFSPEVVALP